VEEWETQRLSRELAEVFSAHPENFRELIPLSGGISNTSYRFEYRGAVFVVRVSAKSENLQAKLRREQEIYTLLSRHRVNKTDEPVYFSVNSGVKVTKFIHGTRHPDPENPGDMARCMSLLKSVHDSGVELEDSFDLEACFFSEESRLRSLSGLCPYLPDYNDIRAGALEIYRRAEDIFPVRFGHIDPIKYNFLFTSGKDYLIDFEYSGMASPMIDLAAFAVYNSLSNTQIDRMLRFYLGHDAGRGERNSLYKYLSLMGLYSAIWYAGRIGDNNDMAEKMETCYKCAAAYSGKAGK
jgi:thiamine kinase-like enzyme